MTKRSPLLVAVAATALVLGACNGGGKTSPLAGNHPAATPSSAAESTTQPPVASAVDPNAPEVNTAGDIPDNQVFVPYAPPSGNFALKVPEGWGRSDAGQAVVFTNKLNSIRIETSTAASAPTTASAAQVEVPAIRAASKNFEPGKVTEVRRKAANAVLITYRADSEASPVTGKVIHLDVERYEFWRNGNQVTLTLSGPQGADNVDPWRMVTDSFAWR